MDNVVDALMLCGHNVQVDGKIFNLSDNCTMEKFVAIISEALGKNTPWLRLPKWPIRQSAYMLRIFENFPLTLAN